MQSAQPATTVHCRWLSLNNVPLWRFLVSQEDRVEENLAKMSPGGAAKLRSQYATARCALEEGQWEAAMSRLLRCRDTLKDEEARVGRFSYGLLLLWAEFPLAQMYQMRGSADGSSQMLRKAVETWREVFDAIMPFLMDPALGLDRTVLSFLHTAEYECGCANGDSVMKAHAMQNYAALMEYVWEDDAEHELCLLLSYDYYGCGSFEDSLKWIQKANQLWKQSLPPAAYLRWEVHVLMKLQRFKEARSALDRLSSAPVPALEVATRAEEFRRWKQDCDMQIFKNSASDGDLQEPIEDEELRELQYAMEISVALNSNQEQAAQPERTEAATPVRKIIDEMLTPDSTSVRSWLSVHEHFKTAYSHINSKLPEGPRVALSIDLQRSSEALKQKHFGLAVFRLHCFREVLRTTMKCIENEAYYSILAAVDHLLADLYQFCEDPQIHCHIKALEIRKELLNCIQHVPPSIKYMEQHYMSLVILTEYQGCSSEDVSREQIVQKYASLMGMKKEQAECDMCFWLFFRDNCLCRKLSRLKNEVMPRWDHSGINHSLPYTHLMRCEVELLLDTVKFLIGEDGDEYDLGTVNMLLEQAVGILKDLTQRFEGQSSYESWVHSMLEECYLKMCKCATAAGDREGADGYQELVDMESALCLSLVLKLGLHDVKKPPCIAVSNRSHLIQAEAHVMEQYYWVRFPSDHYLAFQKLYEIGHDAQDEGDWESAVFNLELCRDLLKRLKERFKNAEFNSSLAWIDLPLVQLHHMKTKNLKKSLDLRQEIRDCIGSMDADPYVQLAVNANLHAAIYHLGHSTYPSWMDEIMNGITKLVPKSEFDREIEQLVALRDGGVQKDMDKIDMSMMEKLMNEIYAGKRREFWECLMLIQGPNYWEYHIVSTLLYWHFVQGDYETALDIIGVLKQVVAKHFPKDQAKKEQNVVFEAGCLMELKMFQDAELVLEQASEGKRFDKLSRPIQQSMEMCRYGISGIHAALFETSQNVSSNKTDSMNVLFYLRITGFYCQYLKRYKNAVVFHTECTNIIEAARNDPSINLNRTHRASNIITEHRGLPGWYDYFNLGISFRKMFETRMRSNRESLWTHPHSSNVELEDPSILDTEFTSALRNFQQQIKLVVNPDFIARANHEILKLYATMDESYFGWLLIKYGFKDAHAKHFDHEIADMNDVELMEDENHTKKAQCNLTSIEQSILEEVEANMIKYGRRTSLQFANSLYAMKGRYTESWINMLEGHKDVYAKLQRHYLNKMFLEALTISDHNPELQPKIMDEYRWKAFLYAERQRSRVLLYQLGPQKLTSLVARQLWEFDINDLHAMDTVRGHVAALEKDSVFVEYNHLQDNIWIIYVVQAGTLSHYLLTLKSKMKRLERAIRDVLWHLNNEKSPKKGYSDDKMNEDLEYLHDLLIKPIASHLCQMKLHHKLILAPTELLTKVPFAALRDCTRLDKEKYLVQRHTISLVPSLRAFQRCNERLEALQNFDFHEGPGAIIALGDPTYGKVGEWEPLSKLFGTKTEVDNIARAFSKVPVVKLLGEDATAEKLLHWVANPLHKSSRQIIVHIGAHGSVDDEDERNSCLFLARTSAAMSSAAGSSTSGSSTAARKRMDDELHMDDEVGTLNEDSAIKVLSDEVNRTIREVKEMKISRDKKKKKGKSKVEGKGKTDTKEMEKGKEEESIELVEISAEDAVEWAKDPDKKPVKIHLKLFVEYPELKTKPTNPPKNPYKYGPHICSVLALKDISNSKIPWRAELVVLGACHTSEGKATAEGLVNLARAFIIAGVPCVVASQWAVPDEPTSVLMKEFYNKLRHGNDVASSLRSAMSSMIAVGHHVRAWAPFVIWGSSSLVLPESLHCEGCDREDCRPLSKAAVATSEEAGREAIRNSV